MLAIAGGKGGCGKTTVTVGLARALAHRGRRPLVIDGDCDMPDLHHRLGLSRGGVDALARGKPLDQAVSKSPHCPGVSVLSGGQRDNLSTALLRAVCWDGPVLVDCSAGINADSLRPLRHAESVLVVSTDEPQCIEDAEQTRVVTRRLQATLEGVLLRETAGRGRTEPPPEWSVLERVPFVERPLQNRTVQHAFRNLSRSMFPEKEKDHEVQSSSNRSTATYSSTIL